MTPQAQAILQSARVAELRTAATTIAALCKAAPVALQGLSSSARDRRLLLLLARERQRANKLLELLRNE
jgi:hypothetical protein